jgi:hypothetical protein
VGLGQWSDFDKYISFEVGRRKNASCEFRIGTDRNHRLGGHTAHGVERVGDPGAQYRFQSKRNALRNFKNGDLENILFVVIGNSEEMPALPLLDQPDCDGWQDSQMPLYLSRILE